MWGWSAGGIVLLLFIVAWLSQGFGLWAEPQPTMTPTETLSAALTQEPTDEPTLISTSTPKPSPTPTSTSTPRPPATSTPRPEPSPTPTETPIPSPTWPPDVPPVDASKGDKWIRPADGAEMVYVPAGEFLMGSNEGDDFAYFDDEYPQHTVTLDAFWIDKYEVTNAQFAAFLNAEGNQEEGGATWLKTDSDAAYIHQQNGTWQVDKGYGEHPVGMVSWYGARAYAEWVGGRLPSEAEWEKAARGTDGRIYPWGNEPPTADLCNIENNVGGTTPVGTYSPAGDSPYGCADMTGNVAEWTRSLYKDYPYDAQDGREDRDTKGISVLRGGSYPIHRSNARAAYRGSTKALARFVNFGFRVCVSP